jgi:hypothetical protein
MRKLKGAAGDTVQLPVDLRLVVDGLGADDGRYVAPWCLRSCGDALLIFLTCLFFFRCWQRVPLLGESGLVVHRLGGL